MKPSILQNKDFWAGLFLIAVGAAALILGRNYAFRTALRMWPGYFPTVLGWLMIVFGLYILTTGLRRGDKLEYAWPPFALIGLALALLPLGPRMHRSGFLPASP